MTLQEKNHLLWVIAVKTLNRARRWYGALLDLGYEYIVQLKKAHKNENQSFSYSVSLVKTGAAFELKTYGSHTNENVSTVRQSEVLLAKRV